MRYGKTAMRNARPANRLRAVPVPGDRRGDRTVQPGRNRRGERQHPVPADERIQIPHRPGRTRPHGQEPHPAGQRRPHKSFGHAPGHIQPAERTTPRPGLFDYDSGIAEIQRSAQRQQRLRHPARICRRPRSRRKIRARPRHRKHVHFRLGKNDARPDRERRRHA